MYETYLKHKLDLKHFFNERLLEAFSSGYYGINSNRDFPISAFQCFVCESVHKQWIKQSEKSVYDCPIPRNPFNDDNSWDTFWVYGKCELKALQYFRNEKQWNITEEIFTEKSMEYLRNDDC